MPPQDPAARVLIAESRGHRRASDYAHVPGLRSVRADIASHPPWYHRWAVPGASTKRFRMATNGWTNCLASGGVPVQVSVSSFRPEREGAPSKSGDSRGDGPGAAHAGVVEIADPPDVGGGSEGQSP